MTPAGRSLEEWHALLGAQFTALHEARAATNKPVFALEHGLEASELHQLEEAVRRHIRSAPPFNEHALCWVVYAAEVGYGYSGDEYWQTFAQRTPGWHQQGDRDWVRRKFRSFHDEFGGARPEGAWAKHFSIICWPILHAILPRDLQRQLAQVLFEARHSFSPAVFSSPSALGELIASRSLRTSSRFQNLIQETALIGQLASALLLDQDRESNEVILPTTVRRLRADLEREQAAREWLQDARRVAGERVKLRGLTRQGSSAREKAIEEDGGEETKPLRIEPRLLLRPKDIERSSWDVLLEIPDLSGLVAQFPTARDVVLGSRCIVAGSSGRPLARGRLVQGAQRILLERWPRSDETLLEYEGAPADVQALLRLHFGLRPGPTWLFRIASDGLGYEVRGLSVRPSEQYVIVRTDGRPEVRGRSRPVSLSCEGAWSSMLDFPGAFEADDERMIGAVGLRRTRRVRVAPAGLSASAWDGEGRAEWLLGESPCVVIQADHTLEGATVSLTADPTPLRIGRIEPGAPTFVELEALPLGEHVLTVRTQHYGDSEAWGRLTVAIRPPQAFEGATHRTGPLSVGIDPPTPTFEQLWSGKVSIEITGPEGRQFRATVRLLDRRDGKLLIARDLPPLTLPTPPSRWRTHFRKHFCEAAPVKEHLEAARICEVEILAEELGSAVLRCEREFAPLRWLVKTEADRLSLSLSDDTGIEAEALQGHHYSFSRPDERKPIDASAFARSPQYIDPAGGLFVALRGTHVACVAALPPKKTLAGRQFSARVATVTPSAESAMRALRQIEYWGQARLAGDGFVSSSQREALRALTQQLTMIVAGDEWGEIEADYGEGVASEHDLKRAIASMPSEHGFASAIERAVEELVQATTAQRLARFNELVARFFRDRLEHPAWLCELALRLASDPTDLRAWAREELENGLRSLHDELAIPRAARFLVLAVSRQLAEHSIVSADLYPGWSWE